MQAYLACRQIPERWMTLFDKTERHPLGAELSYTEYLEDSARLTTSYEIMPCEHGEHLHLIVTVLYDLLAGPEELFPGKAGAKAMHEGWQLVAERISEAKVEWIYPCLEQALEIETLHGRLGG